MKRTLPAACLLALASCGSASDDVGEQAAIDPAGEATPDVPVPPPPTEPDLAAPDLADPEPIARLRSKDCAEVVQLYLDALARREYGLAARVWNDPAVDAA
ncbi:MAG TPA: hypothetical protein VI168_16360, partial [Croceibacterium sp.]